MLSKRNTVYLTAPINALVEGYYVDNITVAQIKERGNFGLGTFNYLDGEMVFLDGEVYQIRSDGRVYTVEDKEQTPFACVTFFNPDTLDDILGTDYKDIAHLLDNLLPSKNMLYAIRIDGVFNHVKTRAVPKSENYKPLVEVTKNQPIFDLYDVEGSLVGFYTPAFMESLSAPGYHLHFISSDRKQGGHLIGCDIHKTSIGIQHVPELSLRLPVTLDFLTADLSRDISKDLDMAEK
ncbi:MAG: acetolactate decarboxylase [Desulfobacterales bacterium]|nr:acetolactate decarboxylase [Desulfobacterales bacterium]